MTTTDKGTAREWNLDAPPTRPSPATNASGSTPSRFLLTNAGGLGPACFSPDGRLLAICTHSGTVHLIDRVSGVDNPLAGHIGETTASFSPDGRWLMTTGRDDNHWTVRVSATGAFLSQHIGHGSLTNLGRFLAPSRLLSDGDGELRVWDANTGEHLRTLSTRDMGWFAVSPDGARVAAASGARFKELAIFDLQSPARRRLLSAPAEQARLLLKAEPPGRSTPSPAAAEAWRTLGEWYLAAGSDGWALPALLNARKGGAKVDPAMLAGCHWRLGHLAAAGAEYDQAISASPDEKLQMYLRMCRDGVNAESLRTTFGPLKRF